MELFLLLGFAAFMALVGLGTLAYLRQRRAGTIVAVTIPLRTLPRVGGMGESTSPHR
jgi:hypothetical protein